MKKLNNLTLSIPASFISFNLALMILICFFISTLTS